MRAVVFSMSHLDLKRLGPRSRSGVPGTRSSPTASMVNGTQTSTREEKLPPEGIGRLVQGIELLVLGCSTWRAY